MLPEIAAAVGFLSSLLRTRGCVNEQRLQVFSGALQEALTGEHIAEGPGARRTLTPGFGPLPCLRRLSSPLRAGLPTRAAPGLGFLPAPGAACSLLPPPPPPHPHLPPIPLGPVSPPRPCSRVSVRGRSGWALPSKLSRAQTLDLSAIPSPRLMSRKRGGGATSGSECELISLSGP